MRLFCSNVHALQALNMRKMYHIALHGMKVSFVMLGLCMVLMYLQSMTAAGGHVMRNGTGMNIE
jgi:hypothetical protein